MWFWELIIIEYNQFWKYYQPNIAWGVQLYYTNQLQSPITERFGLGFGLETSENDYKSPYSIGSFSWGGAFSTSYWADPKEKLIALIYTNIYSNKHGELQEKYKALVYQSIVD